MMLLATFVLLLQAVISVHTELVAVPVAVTDDRGQHVAGLTAGNFQVFDDGRRQPIVVFHQGDAAVTLGLVVDRSRSMRDKHSAVIASVAAVLKLSRADDELFGVGFGDAATLALPPSQPFTGSS